MEANTYLEKLRAMRDGYSDEIPEIILHSSRGLDGKPTQTPPKYKVRKGWFQGVISWLEIGIDEGYVKNGNRQLYDEFLKYAEKTKLSNRLTTKEDIQLTNTLLTSVINGLEALCGK